MIHLRPVPRWTDLQQQTHERLKHEIEEERMDSRLPRHFNERQQWRQTGEKNV